MDIVVYNVECILHILIQILLTLLTLIALLILQKLKVYFRPMFSFWYDRMSTDLNFQLRQKSDQ